MKDQLFFQLKNSATKKIVDLFGELERQLKEKIQELDFGIEELNVKTGKIFRGENYRMYPYVVLDYPKLFSTRSIFAFRTMFWWGHEFSFTLHLQGKALDHYRKSIKNNFDDLLDHDVYACVNKTPWQYVFTEENYLPAEEVVFRKEALIDGNFLKLSRKINVSEVERVEEYCLQSFEIFCSLLFKK
jgi:hypothetical protein